MNFRPLAALAVLLLAGTALAADEKWEIQSTVSVTGITLPMSVPTQNLIVCTPPGRAGTKQMIPTRHGCQAVDFTTSGKTSRYRIECPAPNELTGEGQITMDGKDAYTGKLSVTGTMQGQSVQMSTTFSGRRVGTCLASQGAKPAHILQSQAKQNGMNAAQQKALREQIKIMERQPPR